MKISVHLEADSAEELQAFFAAFQATHVKQLAPVVEEDPVFASDKARADREQAVAAESVAPEPWFVDIDKPAEEPVEKPKRGRKPKMAPIIEEPEDEPVEAPVEAPVAAQEAPKTNGVSRQDLLDVFAEYVQRYSANYGYTDISNLLQQNFGGNVRKASDVPEDMLGKAVAAIKAAITDNPFNRKRDYA